MSKLAPYWKAAIGFVAPATTILIYALTDFSAGGTEIVQSEWLLALFTCVGTAGGVWATPNKDPQAKHQAESVQPPQA